MKYLKTLICAVLVCFLLSGCSFRVSSSIDDLISPVSPFGDNADIKKALDDYVQNGYSLKAPDSGDFITSYNFYDLDGNQTEEAIAFYEPGDNLGTIDMAIIQKINDKWTVTENIVGEGKEVHSLEFDDINGDGDTELIVCWNVIAGSSSHELCVYRTESAEDGLKLEMIDGSKTVNNYITVDLYGDKTDELLLFEINAGSSSSAKAELYSVLDNELKLIGETKLDSHITSYENLKIEKAEETVRVYADALGTDGSSMLTEIIYWSRSYDTIVSPFYSYSTGLSTDTIRNHPLPSLDVNGDELIEIPIDYELETVGENISAFDWQIYKRSVLMHAAYSLYAEKDGYIVLIPDKYINKISASYNEERREMTVYNNETNNEVFSIMPVLKATYSDEKYPDYNNVLESSGYCYLVWQGSDEDIVITADELKEFIKTID